MSIPGQGIQACAEVAPERWDAELRAAGVTDVYYARGYVAAAAALVGAEPLLLRHGGAFFACLLRSDPVDVVTAIDGAYDQPSTAADQIRWLAAAGLDAEVVWARQDLCVIVADSPS